MSEMSPVPTDPVPLATADQFIRRFPDLAEGIDPILIQEACVEATSHLEEMVSRRLAPFTGMIYQDRLRGIDPTEYGDESADLPIDIYGALGISYAYALGANNLVRHFWLPDYAPFQPELWQFTINSMKIILTYGNTQNIDFLNGGVIGPDVSDGHCVAPGTRILTSDLQWVPVEELQVGDGLVGFGEAPGTKQAARRYEYSVVEATERLILPCSEVEFEDGSVIVCSDDHRWLVKDSNYGVSWKRTDQLRALDDPERKYPATMVAKPFEPWETDRSYEAGYLAGCFDGEGSLSVNNSTRDRTQVIGVTQRENQLLDAVQMALKERNFDFRDFLSDKPQPDTFTRSEDIHYLTLRGGRGEMMRLLGTIRPPRLLSKFAVDRIGVFFRDPLITVKRVTPVGPQEVVAIQTSSKTYIAEGFASHNCWLRLGTFAPEGTRIYVNYSGGYTLGIPPALRRACLYQAAKFVMLDYEPQVRRIMSFEEIDTQVTRIMVPWYRG
jgi:hypothetical protein